MHLQRIAKSLPVALAPMATTLWALCWIFIATMSPAQAEPNLNDQTISDKIEDELLLDPGVNSLRIDIDTTDGIVTLSGDVSNLLAKERATRIAQAGKGVRAVVNRVQIDPTVSRSDARIQRDVELALASDPATESYEVGVSVDDGTTTLTGTVDSYQERELVKTVAKSVGGVTAIEDQINVDYKTDRPDAEIQEEIEQALKWNALVDSSEVVVGVEDGAVTMSGAIGTAAEKRLAQDDAWVAGAISVDASNLEVKEWMRDDKLRAEKYSLKSEEEIRDAVSDALLYDPRVMSFNVDVDVAGSTVTLRGEVDNLKAKRTAEQDAKNTVGVSTVYNRLKVRNGTGITDEELEDEVRAAMLRDPYVERFEITVDVIDGTAYLYGTVNSRFEKNQADDVASRVIGVLDVVNYLDVEDEGAHIYDPYVDDTYVDEDDLIEYDEVAPLQTDFEIKNSIEDELWWSPFVDSDEINVRVDEGIATLTGTVDTWSESRTATENAYEGGATLVDNDLVVNYD